MTVGDLSGFTRHFVEANGLTHHVLERPLRSERVVLWLHGYLDMAQSFAAVLRGVSAHGYRVLAPDFRGHGESAWAGPGGYYHFADYLADLDALVDALGLERFDLVAHSMGGSVATRYAAMRPERVASLTLLEGIGPPAMPADVAVDRTLGWLDQLRKLRQRKPRVMASRDDAYLRLRVSHPSVSEAVLREVAAFSTRPSEGGLVFRFDPLHQTTAPGRHDAEAFEAFIDRVACPTCLVDGGEVGYWPDFEARSGRYKQATRVTLPGGGHMMHWTVPDALVAAVAGFLGRVGG